jgi:hypothetical protein
MDGDADALSLATRQFAPLSQFSFVSLFACHDKFVHGNLAAL